MRCATGINARHDLCRIHWHGTWCGL